MGYTEKTQGVVLILGWDLCELLTHNLLAVTGSQNAIIC